MRSEVAAPPDSTLRPSFPCTGQDLERARACERVVFARAFGDSPSDLDTAYGDYEDRTSFGAVFLADGRAVGAVRLARPGPRGLKSLNDAASAPWHLPARRTLQQVGIDPARTWDVGTFGVDSLAVRASSRVTRALFAVMFGAFRDNAVASFVAVLDVGSRRPVGAQGVELLDLPGAEPAPYLGSDASTPVYRHVADLHDLHRRRFAAIHDQVFHGRGITGVDPDLCAPGAFRLVLS